MLGRWMNALQKQGKKPPEKTRRAHKRREHGMCVCVIDGRPYPVQNWSLGGLLLSADGQFFGVDRPYAFILKFRLRDSIIDLDLNGKVVRKSPNNVAFQFEPLSGIIRRGFQRVIDDVNAREFAGSQI